MIKILDTTYREGKQSYLGYTLPRSMVEYANLLTKVGIEYMEVAYPFISDTYLKEFRNLIKSKLDLEVSVHSSLNIENFKKLIDEGVTSIDTSLKLDKLNDDEVEHQTQSIARIIKDCKERYGIQINLRVGIEHAFKLPANELVNLCKSIVTIDGISRISLSDTDGTAIPNDIDKALTCVDKIMPDSMPLEIHLHNDHGLVNANLFQAYCMFKDNKRDLVVDVSMGGIGERNGIVSVGDILSLLYLYSDNKYNNEYYADLYQYIFNQNTFNRDPLNPEAFSHSSGLHITKFLESGSYQSINPDIFGYNTKLVFNELISSDAVRLFANKNLNIEITKEEALKIVQEFRNKLVQDKEPLNEDEFIKYLLNKVNKI